MVYNISEFLFVIIIVIIIIIIMKRESYMSLLSFGRGWGGLFLFTRAAFINNEGSSYLGNTCQVRNKEQRISEVCAGI